MLSINMNSPRNASEARTLGRATQLMKAADQRADALKELDNSKQDLNPTDNRVAVDGVSLGESNKSHSGVAEYDEQGKLTRMDLEQDRRVELEVDHMMWGTYRGKTTSQVTKTEQMSQYHITDEVPGFLTRDYEITVNHETGILTFDYEQSKGRYFNRSRGLS